MEKWEYDLGNPQEEAPRRIQKKNYKKRLKWLGIAAAVVLAVVAVALLWDHGSFDRSAPAPVIYPAGAEGRDGLRPALPLRRGEERGVHIARWELDYGLRRADQRPR